MKENLLQKSFLLATVFVITSLCIPMSASAASLVTGSLWSDNIGWIMFGVNGGTLLEQNDGSLSGYGWSDNIGWVKFGGLSGFPTGSGTQAANARFDPTDKTKLVGWARACSGTVKSSDAYLNYLDYPSHYPDSSKPGDCSTMVSRPDGWDGWIGLFGTTYGSTLNGNAIVGTVGDSFSGWGWGSDVMGWLQANLTFALPTATNISVATSCGTSDVTVSWQAAGSHYNDTVAGYYVLVKNPSGGKVYPVGNPTLLPSTQNSFVTSGAGLSVNTSYYAVVQTLYSSGFRAEATSTPPFVIPPCNGPGLPLCNFQSGSPLQSYNYPEDSGPPDNAQPPVRPLVGKPVVLSTHIVGGTPPYRVVWIDDELPAPGTTQTVNGGENCALPACNPFDPVNNIWTTNANFTRIYATIGYKNIVAYICDSNHSGACSNTNYDAYCPFQGPDRPYLKVKPVFQEY